MTMQWQYYKENINVKMYKFVRLTPVKHVSPIHVLFSWQRFSRVIIHPHNFLCMFLL